MSISIYFTWKVVQVKYLALLERLGDPSSKEAGQTVKWFENFGCSCIYMKPYP